MKEYSITSVLINDSLDKAISHYGLEGTEEAIKRVYKNHPIVKEQMLNEYYRRIK